MREKTDNVFSLLIEENRIHELDHIFKFMTGYNFNFFVGKKMNIQMTMSYDFHKCQNSGEIIAQITMSLNIMKKSYSRLGVHKSRDFQRNKESN